MLKKILLFALILGIGWLLLRLWRRVPRGAQATELSVRDLQRGLRAGESWVVVDVRGAAEFNDDLGHIHDARHVPLEALAVRIKDCAPSATQAIALVCRTGSRARQAQRVLGRLGYQHACVVRGGMQEWVAAQLPVVRGG
ncbi:MAG: rhodanese-like domain-containing protein [Pseudomonadota bacterium]